MQSDYDNGIYWETPGTYIYSAEVKINKNDVPFYILMHQMYQMIEMQYNGVQKV